MKFHRTLILPYKYSEYLFWKISSQGVREKFSYFQIPNNFWLVGSRNSIMKPGAQKDLIILRKKKLLDNHHKAKQLISGPKRWRLLLENPKKQARIGEHGLECLPNYAHWLKTPH